MKRWPPATTAPSTGEGADRLRAMRQRDRRPRRTAQGTTKRPRSPVFEPQSRLVHPPGVGLDRSLPPCDLRTRPDAALNFSSRWRNSQRYLTRPASSQPRRCSLSLRPGNDPRPVNDPVTRRLEVGREGSRVLRWPFHVCETAQSPFVVPRRVTWRTPRLEPWVGFPSPARTRPVEGWTD
jgi:hypothetical protein